MRLAYVHSGADLYGASRSLLRLASRLVRDGHSVLAVLPFDGPLRPALASEGVQVRVAENVPLLTRSRFRRVKSLVSLPGEVRQAARELEAAFAGFRPDLVHSNTATVLLAPALAARRLRLPHVWHVREFFTEFGPLWPVYRALLCSFADRVLCVSSAVAGQFTESQRRSRVSVIHNGFPAAEFGPVTGARRDALRDKWGVGDAPLAGVIGRIKYRRKGQETFVEAAARLAGRLPDARFAVVGTPFPGNESHGTRLADLVRQLKIGHAVVMPGEEADMRAVYAALDLVVLPSGQPEPFGGVVIEAMASGKPVVGTAIGGTVEQVADGVTGVLVPPNDPDTLAASMERLLKNRELRARMGRAARRRFEERFEFEPFYSRMNEIYQQVLLAATPATLPRAASAPAP